MSGHHLEEVLGQNKVNVGTNGSVTMTKLYYYLELASFEEKKVSTY